MECKCKWGVFLRLSESVIGVSVWGWFLKGLPLASCKWSRYWSWSSKKGLDFFYFWLSKPESEKILKVAIKKARGKPIKSVIDRKWKRARGKWKAAKNEKCTAVLIFKKSHLNLKKPPKRKKSLDLQNISPTMKINLSIKTLLWSWKISALISKSHQSWPQKALS